MLTSQYPPRSAVAAMATTGTGAVAAPAEPKNRYWPKVNTPPSDATIQYPGGGPGDTDWPEAEPFPPPPPGVVELLVVVELVVEGDGLVVLGGAAVGVVVVAEPGVGREGRACPG